MSQITTCDMCEEKAGDLWADFIIQGDRYDLCAEHLRQLGDWFKEK